MGKIEEKEFLIIDDEATLREILVDEFELLGAVCTGAGDGKEGLELAKSKQFDVIISDIRMPIMDGIEFLENLKKEAPEKYPKVILLSGFADVSRDEALDLGAIDLVEKPWDMDKLIKIIEDAL